MIPAPLSVFSEIALSLSGGGYRAAAFHLGTLRMLHKLNLLDSVKVLSTVSGGTITGASYACWLADGGENFEDFSRNFEAFLLENHVISKALTNLSNAPAVNGVRMMPSLIRSAAQIYSENLAIQNKNLDSLINGQRTQFKEVVFNSTDFRTGNCFRFQISDNIGVRTGNNRGKVKSEINKQIRIADIVAASSCFPAGFEPIRFPCDFTWSEEIGLENIRRTLGENFKEEVPLMDGGVFDNQGIDSIMNIYRRKDAEIELYIISDTDQRGGNILESKIKQKGGMVTINHLYFLGLLLTILAAVTSVALVVDFMLNFDRLTFFRGLFLYFIPFVFSFTILMATGWLRAFLIEQFQSLRDRMQLEIWENVKNLSIAEFAELVISRVSSLSAMTQLVFMKRIRDMGFKRIYTDENFRKKVIPVLIYDMDNPSKWQSMRSDEFAPSENLRNVAKRAEAYPTNLWVTNREDFENLIECGEATACFQVVKYLKEQKAAEISIPGSPHKQLYDAALEIWTAFKSA
jgi:predicted acylesterase/phospholipase RssA